jgi:hypothetical protein
MRRFRSICLTHVSMSLLSALSGLRLLGAMPLMGLHLASHCLSRGTLT